VVAVSLKNVLSYGATYHALLLDTDDANTARFEQAYIRKLADLRRANNRKGASRQTVMRSAADAPLANQSFRIPLLRSTQLETLLL
jgi:hypothetical protein